MGYKSVSVIVTDRAADAAALKTAQAAAARHDGHLDVHCVGLDPARYEPLPIGSAAVLVDSGLSEARERADALVAWVSGQVPADAPNVGVEGVVVPQLGLNPGIARLVRYSDLVVCTRPYAGAAGPIQISVLEAALFSTDTPVLVAAGDRPDRAIDARRVMVAWNETDEALSALRKALPILRAADRVDVVMVDPPSHSPERSDPGGAVTLMLARHGVRAEVSILARTLPQVSACLIRFAREHDSDLIVMGAYGHSRFREAVLGGATRDLLGEAPVPLFMSR